MERKKKIVFNEEVDSAITGYALAITFIGTAIYLANNLYYFGSKFFTIIIIVLFSLIGVGGTFLELGNNKFIKGIDDLGIGLISFFVWGCLAKLNIALINGLIFILLVFGIYELIYGFIKLIVSVFYKSDSENNKSIGGKFITILPAIASSGLTIVNIVKVVFEIKGM